MWKFRVYSHQDFSKGSPLLKSFHKSIFLIYDNFLFIFETILCLKTRRILINNFCYTYQRNILYKQFKVYQTINYDNNYDKIIIIYTFQVGVSFILELYESN